MGGGGSGRPAAPIFTPPATRNGARKKKTRRRLTKSSVCERHGNPPCPMCALTHKGVRHCCGKGHHGHPKGVCIPCTPRHTPLRARLASQRTPGTGGTPAPKRPVGRVPPGGLHARHGPAHSPAPSGRVRGMKQQRETPPPPGETRRHLTLYSRVLLGSLPHQRWQCFTFSHSHGSAVWGVFTTADV